MSKNILNQQTLIATSLKLRDITITAPQGASYTLLLPTTDGGNNQVLTTDGTGVLSWSSIAGLGGGTVTSVSASVPSFLSVVVSNATSTPAITITNAATPTGTGLLVLQTSPTLITPVLGVASGTSLTLSTPLSAANGGTGLATVGVSGTFLTSNGSTLSYATPSMTNYISTVGTLMTTSGANRTSKTVSASILDKQTRPIVDNITPQTLNSFLLGVVSGIASNQRALAYSPKLDRFVIGSAGTATTAYSSNGITWTAGASAITIDQICWSPELAIFCCLSSGTQNYTSTDGITFTSRTGISGVWAGICWAPELGLFCAVGNAGAVQTSPDGITWTSRTGATATNWANVTWSSELSIFVACSNSGTLNRIMTSPDGITWTSRTTPIDQTWSWVEYSPYLGLFVVVNSNTTASYLTSPDGITWTSRTTLSTSMSCRQVKWIPWLYAFVICGEGNIMYSFDAITWTTVILSTTPSASTISLAIRFAFSNDTIIIIPNTSTQSIIYSVPQSFLGFIPIPTYFGGTGTASIGTTGQYAIVNAGATGISYTTGPGGGGVSQVGLAGDADMNSFLTISSNTSNPITATGTFTLTMNAAPVITGNTSIVGDFSVSGTTTLTTPLSTGNGGTGTTSTTGTGSVVFATTPTLVTPIIGAATGTSLSVTGQLTSTVATGTAPLVVSSTTNVANLNASTLNGATFANPGAIGATPSTGNFTSITLSTPLSVANGGTGGTTTATGTGGVVLQNTPTLVTPVLGVASGTSLNLSGLTASYAVATDASKNLVSVQPTGTGKYVLENTPTLITPVLGAATGTSLSVTGQLTSTVSTGTAPLVVSSTTNVANLNASTLNGATFANPGAIGATPSTGNFTSIALSTPLSTAYGGTGLSTVGSNNQVLTISGGVPTWSTPAPGLGTVTQVNFAVDSTLSGVFTNTGVSSITSSGTFTLSQAASPVFYITGSNYLAISNSSATGSDTLLVLQPNLGVNQITRLWIGKAAVFDGSAGVFQYKRYSSDSDVLNEVSFGIGTGVTSSYLVLTNGSGATLSSTLNVTSSIISGDFVRGTSLHASNGGIAATNITYDNYIILNSTSSTVYGIDTAKSTAPFTARTLALQANGGLVTIGTGGLTIGTPLSATSGGTGSSAAASGTGSVVLNSAPTIYNPVLSGALPLDSISFPASLTHQKISMYGVPSNGHEFDGFGTDSNTLRYQVNTSSNNHIFYSSVNASSSLELFRVKGTGGFTSNGNSSITGTLNTTNGVTIGATGVSAAIADRKLVLFDNEVTPNNYQYYGLAIGPGALKYQINDSAGAHIFYSGLTSSTQRELFRIDGDGNTTARGTAASAPKYCLRYLDTSQTISNAGGPYSITNFTTVTNTTGLTAGVTSITNSTGASLIISATLVIKWDTAALGGVCDAKFIRSDNVPLSPSFTTTIYSGNNAVLSGTAIFELPHNYGFRIEVLNSTGFPLNAIGGTSMATGASQMYVYVLN